MDILLKERQIFETDRFTVTLLSPVEGRELSFTLLQDEALVAQLPWVTKKTPGWAAEEASRIEQDAASGLLKIWGIAGKEQGNEVGAIIARNTLEGIDVEVLVLSQFWGDEVGEETGEPVLNWLEENSEMIQSASVSASV